MVDALLLFGDFHPIVIDYLLLCRIVSLGRALHIFSVLILKVFSFCNITTLQND